MDTKKLTGEALFSGLCYVQSRLMAVQEQAERYIALEGQYQIVRPVMSRADFGGLEGYEMYKAYKPLAGLRKLGLVRFAIPAALSIFFGIMELIASLLRGGFNFECLIPFGCLALLVAEQRAEKPKLRIFTHALLALCVYLEIKGILRAGMNPLTWILLFISAAVTVPLMLALNRAAKREMDRRTDEYNMGVTAKNQARDAKRQQADNRYRQHVNAVRSYNRGVPTHNRSIAAQQRDALEKSATIMEELTAHTQDWYPPDYYRLKAVDFFINAVRNGKADTLQELIRMFDEQEKWEDTKAYRQDVLSCLNDIRATEKEQLEVQKEIRDSAKRQERTLNDIRQNQEEVKDLLWQQNLQQVISDIKRDYQYAAARRDLNGIRSDIWKASRQ